MLHSSIILYELTNQIERKNKDYRRQDAKDRRVQHYREIASQRFSFLLTLTLRARHAPQPLLGLPQ